MCESDCKRLYRLLLIRHTFIHTHTYTHTLTHSLALFFAKGQSHHMKSAARRSRRHIELWQTCGINYGFRQSARHQQQQRQQQQRERASLSTGSGQSVDMPSVPSTHTHSSFRLALSTQSQSQLQFRDMTVAHRVELVNVASLDGDDELR